MLLSNYVFNCKDPAGSTLLISSCSHFLWFLPNTKKLDKHVVVFFNTILLISWVGPWYTAMKHTDIKYAKISLTVASLIALWYNCVCWSSQFPFTCAKVGNQKGEMFYKKSGIGMLCRSPTWAKRSPSSRCHQRYVCLWSSEFLRTTSRVIIASSANVGETVCLSIFCCCGCREDGCIQSVLLYDFGLFERATSFLWNLGSWVVSSSVESSLHTYQRLSTMFSFSGGARSLTWRTPTSFNDLWAICIPKSNAVASSTSIWVFLLYHA